MQTNKMKVTIPDLEDIAGTLPAKIGNVRSRSRLIATDEWSDVVLVLKEIGGFADFEVQFNIEHYSDSTSIIFKIGVYPAGSRSVYSDVDIWFSSKVDDAEWSIVSKEDTMKKLACFKARQTGEAAMKHAIEACGFSFE